MITTGTLIEYLDNGKFICALVTEYQQKRVRLINQNGREVNLPVSRIVHFSEQTHPVNITKEILSRQLLDTTERRCALMDLINLEELWELASSESTDSFSPAFLAELIFGEEANDDTISAFLRCVFQDRSEERRVGKECRRLCRSRWSPYH
jgi:exoribonuclease-2